MKKNEPGIIAARRQKCTPRVERWHKFAEERIARLQNGDFPGLDMLRECVVRERCGGAVVEERPKHYFSPEFNAYTDTEYERGTARSRNAHERSVVADMVYYFTSAGNLPVDLMKRHGRRFVRHFYRKGNRGLYEAYLRMVTDALERLRGTPRA
jgi:hypothetical protein